MPPACGVLSGGGGGGGGAPPPPPAPPPPRPPPPPLAAPGPPPPPGGGPPVAGGSCLRSNLLQPKPSCDGMPCGIPPTLKNQKTVVNQGVGNEIWRKR
ncbi:hypothetical protein FCJ59_32480 [Cupriavidus basilensis]|nr:hypothetical protein [Cupriavidus basilensis]